MNPVKYASDCIPCPDCGEPYCEDCGTHYADCACPGPHSEEEPDLGEEVLLETARATVSKILRAGHKQGHGAKTWIKEPMINHTLKAGRHALTAQLMAEGWTPCPDDKGETLRDHLERSALRALMALAVYDQR